MIDRYSDEIEDNQNLSKEDNFDITGFINLITRNKSFIAKITLISTFISGIFALTSKRVWEGQFQIVVDNNKNNETRLSGELSQISQLFAMGGASQRRATLQTQVGILSSPMVLMDVFDFVQKEKSKKGKKSFLYFDTWKKKSFKILIQKKTSILDISYKDSDMELIIPVLSKIAKSYQDYSGSQRLRELELGSKYFEEQISFFKKKSNESLSLAQEFVIDQDLAILNTDKIEELDKEIPNFISIEAVRSSSANEIRGINFQLDKLNSIENDESLIYLGRTIAEIDSEAINLTQQIDLIDKSIIELKVLKEEFINTDDPSQVIVLTSEIENLAESDLVKELIKLNDELEFKKFIFTKNDTGIKKLEEKRNNLTNLVKSNAITFINSDLEKSQSSRPKLISLLKSQAKSFLEAKKLNAEIRLKAAERPKEILMKYRELTDNAYRDKVTLDNLEKEYRILLLEKAKSQDPWDLITTPKLNPYPVAPSRKLILIQGFLIGFILSCLVAYISEKRKQLIYANSDIKNILKIPLFSEISINNNEIKLLETFKLIQNRFNTKNDNFVFILAGEINIKVKNNLNRQLKKIFDQKKSLITTNFIDAINYSQVIILVFEGISKTNDIYNLKNQISIYNKNPIGFIYVKDHPLYESESDEIEALILNIRSIFLTTKKKLLEEIRSFKLSDIKNKFKYYYSLVKKGNKE